MCNINIVSIKLQISLYFSSTDIHILVCLYTTLCSCKYNLFVLFKPPFSPGVDGWRGGGDGWGLLTP